SKLYQKEKSMQESWTVIAVGAVGALAYTFSDTFWFSAVEAEVYSLSILFTAVVFWAVLKWENNEDDRWLVLIAFIVGLSIGVHLLSLLAIPAIVLVYHFKKNPKSGVWGIVKAIGAAGLIWFLVQYLVIQYTVLLAAKFDLFFVNSLDFGFGSGAVFFLLALFSVIAYGIYYSIKHKKYNLNLSLICLTFVLFGFSSYFLIIIRANAKPNLNLSNPDNAYSLYNYLGRTNYGQTPLLYGQTFDAQQVGITETGTQYRRGQNKYEDIGKDFKAEYDKNMLLPRMYSNKPHHVDFYKQWMNLSDGETPSFFKNLSFMASYQMGFMYWRYFMWNFAGKQNDFQGQGSQTEGNWLTGIKPLDGLRLEKQSDLPLSITANAGYNRYFGLPLILGIAGLLFLFRRNRNDLIVVTTLFFFTGLAIILYLNQDPMQVRERDYAYVGSFYAFAIFIGFGVLPIKEFLSKYSAPKLSLIAAVVIGVAGAPAIMGFQGWDDHNRSGKTTALEWASNYLNSCAPNAILFTNADNDTFPLWYAQEVEGIRTDVRVVNLQYLSDDAYINQMKQPMGKSAPLPISMPESKYVKGIRDYLRYVDYGITDSVELKDLLAVLTSDHNEDKVPLQDGSYENFLPSKHLKLTVDIDQVIKTQTVAAKDKAKITPKMEWFFNQNFAGKANMTMFDILANNNWKRPIYFGTSISDDTYIGLEKYLYLEGYAHRLLPLERDTADKRDKMEVTNSEVMYQNVMNKFQLKGFKTASYLDEESRRIASTTWTLNNTLAMNLIMEGQLAKANNLLVKSIRELPMRNYSIDDTVSKLQTIQALYMANNKEAANKLVAETTDYLSQEIGYIISLDPKRYEAYGRDLQRGFFVLDRMHKATEAQKETALTKMLQQKIEELQAPFI
ncbi:MAG: DUF2723 domain-containing protein, partial [Bacteroidota bacterium]